MCGILGAVAPSHLSGPSLKKIIDPLFLLSESRGREASGLAYLEGDHVHVLKQPIPASTFIKTSDYATLFDRFQGKPTALIGHSRLVTNGALEDNDNNQPVSSKTMAMVHNGIVTNEEAVWSHFPALKREHQVDTEVLVRLFDQEIQNGQTLPKAAARIFNLIEGSASIAILHDSRKLFLATNTGSLYFASDDKSSLFLFASEKFILTSLLKEWATPHQFTITPLKAHHSVLVDVISGKWEMSEWIPGPVTEKIRSLSDDQSGRAFVAAIKSNGTQKSFSTESEKAKIEIPNNLIRCVKCILPSTLPFIEFNDQGVCNYCLNQSSFRGLGTSALEDLLKPYRSQDGSPDCIVGFSGGRDSSYGLHYLKKEMKLNPIALTFDWGVITDLARRNQARVCGQLGVEHIVVSADIRKKREAVRNNVEAWLKKPDLGLVPLFMAGDKQYFHFLNQLREQTGIDVVINCENPMERTSFKTGFCGVKINVQKNRIYNVSAISKLQIFLYHARAFAQNPAYLKSSLWGLWDGFLAYLSSYIISHKHIFLFDYIPWDENRINKTLVNDYHWEIARDSKTTWRIGDGTAPFYNYIYYRVAGFTENDVLRSNQIREGFLTREEALRKVEEENQPRMSSLIEYADIIGFDWKKAIHAIDSIPRLYENPNHLKPSVNVTRFSSSEKISTAN